MELYTIIIGLVVIFAVWKLFFSGKAEPTSVRPNNQKPGSAFDTRTGSEKVQAWLIDKACVQCGEDIRNDSLATQRLNENAEKLLQEIKLNPKVEINIPFLTADANGPKHFNISVSQKDLQGII